MKPTFKNQFTRTEKDIRDCNVVEFKKPSMVKESLSYAVDINTIYENYCKTGKVPLNGNQPIYDENFVSYDNLIDAQKTVQEATLYFNNLPTDIKQQYGNSLEKFVKAVQKGDQYLIDKGVFVKPQKAVTEEQLDLSDKVLNSVPTKEVVSTSDVVNTATVAPVNTATTDVV